MTQLLEVLDDWSQALDNGINTDITYLDFQKAFDSVPHYHLLGKIDNYGIRGNLLLWIKAFLTERRQKVMVNGTGSSWARVRSGVPQGSVLGPLLFIIFINDMPETTSSTIKLFADDAKVYHKIHTHEDCHQIQSDLSNLLTWSNKWLMRFHPQKCTVLRLGRDPLLFDYSLDGTSLKVKASEKDLGVTIDNKLKFDIHIANITNKANKMTGLLWRTFEYIDAQMFTALYKTMIRPHLEYAVSVWSPPSWKLADMIEKVQRRATKRVPELSHLPYEDRLRKLKLPTLVYRRIRGDLINTFKYVTGLYDAACGLTLRSGQNHLRGHQFKLEVKSAKTERHKATFNHRVVPWWNSLPENVVTASTVDCFKNRLDSHFKDHPMIYNYKALDSPIAPRMTVQ